jgi:ketosteroid isomerase-like protein
MQALLEIEQIKKLKYRYFRHLDCKQFEAMLELFADGSSTSYDSGRHSYQGKPAIRAFFDDAMSDPKILHQHQGHHPEIELTGDATATGVWYMDDTVHVLEHNLKIRGNGIYWDEYVKVDGQWRILHTGYERIWEYSEALSANALTFKSMFDDAERTRRGKRIPHEGEPALVYWEGHTKG